MMGDSVTDLLGCPQKGCLYTETVSTEDPDASMDEMLSHIKTQHPDMDQTPAVLWPLIELRTE
jgi:hypothetical protein